MDLFLIENGKIVKPIGRLRFTQSFMASLAPGNVLSIGDIIIKLASHENPSHVNG